jgi:hypothetical protein
MDHAQIGCGAERVVVRLAGDWLPVYESVDEAIE